MYFAYLGMGKLATEYRPATIRNTPQRCVFYCVDNVDSNPKKGFDPQAKGRRKYAGSQRE